MRMHTPLRMLLPCTPNLVFLVSPPQHSRLRTHLHQCRPQLNPGRFSPLRLPVQRWSHLQQSFQLQQQPRVQQPVIHVCHQTESAQLSTKVRFKLHRVYRYNKVDASLIQSHARFIVRMDITPLCLHCHRSFNDHQS